MKINVDKIRANGEVKWCINFLMKTFHCRMFEVKKGKIYYIANHYKYLNWIRDSPRARIGEVKLRDGFYYQTVEL